MLERAKLKICEYVIRVRPEQVAALAKWALTVRRQYANDETGCKFWVDPITLLGIDILRHGTYEPQMKALVLGLLGPTDTFIDLGANEGYFSIIAASRALHGRVLSIEPQSALRPVLLENLRINDARPLEVYSVAIGRRKGTARLFVRSSINQGASRLDTAFRMGFGVETVEITTLEDFCAKHGVGHARLMKIDCEGGEVDVIGGSPALFDRHAFDVIALEYHPSAIGAGGCRKIHDQLTASRYKLAQWRGQTIYYVESAADALATISSDIRLDSSL